MPGVPGAPLFLGMIVATWLTAEYRWTPHAPDNRNRSTAMTACSCRGRNARKTRLGKSARNSAVFSHVAEVARRASIYRTDFTSIFHVTNPPTSRSLSEDPV
jgi:hypothetical protein